ncbi:MAG: type II secretion system protein [Gammaproteobacteria bacterium]
MNQKGFTLIELMIVVAIMGIIATMAIPNMIPQLTRAKMVEINEVTAAIKPQIVGYYREHGRFPRNNAEAGLPPPDKLISTYIAAIEVVGGALHVQTRSIGHGYDGVISIRPQVVDGSPRSPVTWICGHRPAADGLTAVGDNRTTIRGGGLPFHCI